nr:autorepressor SdpR family transcription factor [uncultured Olsenella sp.]
MAGEAFKTLSDPTRRRILELLRAGDLSAGQIAEQFDISKPSISNHLGILRSAGLVSSERQGQSIVYHLNMTVLQEVMEWFYSFGER